MFEKPSSSFTCDSNFEIRSTSKSFKIDFDAEAFEKHVLSEASHLQDDYNDSSHSLTISNSSDSSCCNEIEEMIRKVSKVLEKKSNKFINCDSQCSSTCPPLPSAPK